MSRRRLSLRAGALALTLALVGGLPAAGAALAQGLAPVGSGEVRALLIGINAYESQPVLQGAVADAEDLERTLRGLGVRDLRLLRDREASRAAILREMERLIAAAGLGDLVILTFAGHGTRMPEHFAGSNPRDDAFDEVFVLSGFGERGPPTGERILDKEINTWLRRLDDKGAAVLFVADTCHGGGLTRATDARVGPVSYRQAAPVALTGDQFRSIATARDARLSSDDFKTVTFVAAVDAFTKAPEVRVPGEAVLRGAVSFAVARALEGGADRNGDGITTRRELIGYARQQAMQLSDGLQTPTSSPGGAAALDAPVFRKVAAAAPGASPAPMRDPPRPAKAAAVLKVAVLNGPAGALAAVEPLGTRFVVVDRGAGPDLLWDATAAEALSPVGDVIARDVKARDVPDVVERLAALAAIQVMTERRAQAITVLPDSRLHRAGERVSVQVSELAGRHLILFNIAGDGTVQYLFPRNRPSEIVGETTSLPFKIAPPFGTDRMVAVVSDKRLPALEEAISRLDNRRAAARVPGLLDEHLSGSGIRLGHAGLFTAP